MNNHPFIVEIEPRTYSWCSCGMSAKQPFCDGSHGPTGMFPKAIQFTEKKRISFCGCKATKNPPFCDGSHKSVRE